MKLATYTLSGVAAAFILAAVPAAAASPETDGELLHADFVEFDDGTFNGDAVDGQSELYTEARYRGRSRGFRSRGVRSRGFSRSRGFNRGNRSFRNRGHFRGRSNSYYYDDYYGRSSFRNGKRFKKRRLRSRRGRY